MQVGKLSPYNNAKVTFNGWQEIGHFTSAGSETDWSLTVDGDTDLVYQIRVRNLDADDYVLLQLNADSGTNYGYVYFNNAAGTTGSTKVTNGTAIYLGNKLGFGNCILSAKSGMERMAIHDQAYSATGTTVGAYMKLVSCWSNTTSNLASLKFSSAAGTFTTGTDIIVETRRTK